MAALSRRSFLAGAGLALAGLPFVRALTGLTKPAAAAAKRGATQRFVAVYAPHGMAKEYWRPGPDFDLSYEHCSLAPFDDAATFGQSFRDRLLTIEGLDLTSGIEGGTTGHNGSRVLLTGAAGDGRNASLDQYLALDRGFGAATRLSSLVLGIGSAQSALGSSISYATGGLPLPKLIDPTQTFNLIFGDLVGTDPQAKQRAEWARRQGQSSLDFLVGDLQRLTSELATPERAKLEQHLTAFRELERRLGGFELSCTVPTAPDPATFPRLLAYGGGEPYFDVIVDLQVELLAQALACDVTRFATLFLADLSRTRLDAELPSDVHNDVAHRYDAARSGDLTTGTEASWRLLARQNRYCHSKVARLMQKLAEFGVLDETLILVTSDMGDPAAHSSRSVPTLLAGGTAGRWQFGRSLVLADGTPNNRVLVSIAQLFGVEIASFGESPNPATTTGTLAGL